MDGITQGHLNIHHTFSQANQSSATSAEQPEAPPNNMEAAQTAIGKILGNSGKKDTTVEREVAPAVEHETITKEHETKEQEVIDRERHQHHYHTTVQPLKDREVEDTQHDHRETATEYRETNNDEAGNKVKANVEAQRDTFKNETHEGETREKTTDEGHVIGEQVHHHLHETVQPVIEKETVKPSVTHVTKPVHEVVTEETQDHGTTTNSAMSVSEFQGRLDGEAKEVRKTEGAPQIDEV